MPKHTFALAGSTERIVTLSQSLVDTGSFEPTLVLSAAARPVGRRQELQIPAPIHWGRSLGLPVLSVDKKIDSAIQNQVLEHKAPDFLLVVDFRFMVPQWLLQWPRFGAINVHPSALPRWRGSSPSQFCLLYGESESAVTIMLMDTQLDHGPIIRSIPFSIPPSWTSREYYDHSFSLAHSHLADTLRDFFDKKLTAAPQQDASPTPIARQLSRADGFIPWELIIEPDRELDTKALAQANPLLATVAEQTKCDTQTLIYNAWRGLTPWPGIWTMVATLKGERRVKILEMSGPGQIMTGQIEGKTAAEWKQICPQILH